MIPLPLARIQAERALLAIEPHVRRVVIVGSVRRYSGFPRDVQRARADSVKDVELLVFPKTAPADLFGGGQPDLTFVDQLLPKMGRILKGGGPNAKYLQISPHPTVAELQSDPPATLEIFICTPPASWGALMAIRTGPASFSKELVTRLRTRGRKMDRGCVWIQEPGFEGSALWDRFPTPTEEEFFVACGVEFIAPEQRFG